MITREAADRCLGANYGLQWWEMEASLSSLACLHEQPGRPAYLSPRKFYKAAPLQFLSQALLMEEAPV
jgi:hypothetical protein